MRAMAMKKMMMILMTFPELAERFFQQIGFVKPYDFYLLQLIKEPGCLKTHTEGRLSKTGCLGEYVRTVRGTCEGV